jgi:ABC-type phosphate/phosphonate transport system substrate-binding protein
MYKYMSFTKTSGLILGVMIAAFVFGLFIPAVSETSQFRIAIMQDKKGDAKKYAPLLDYLNKRGIEASLVATKNYTHAARMFAAGDADAMFSGSGVAGSMIIKKVAYPLVRPLNKDNWSTYWAVVIAPKGSPRFTQNAEYFRDKKVIFCSLASSGEFYFRSIPDILKVGATMKKAGSHGAAVDALSRGAADVAIVKNRVWEKIKDKYPNLIRVGEDPGENPNGTLILSKTVNRSFAEKVESVLLAVKNDNSPKAKAVRDSLNIQSYIKTTVDDFKYTIPMLKKAGVRKSFNFDF